MYVMKFLHSSNRSENQGFVAITILKAFACFGFERVSLTEINQEESISSQPQQKKCHCTNQKLHASVSTTHRCLIVEQSLSKVQVGKFQKNNSVRRFVLSVKG